MISEAICNLARIPMSMENNPLYQTCLQILDKEDIKPKNTILYEFSKTLKLNSLGDVFGIDELLDIPHTCVFLPWIHPEPNTTNLYKHGDGSWHKFKDTAFVDFDINEKVNKLKKLIKSIQDNGYIPKTYPDRKGGITGYYLGMGDIKRLYIVSGNHRSAVLSALDIDIIWGRDKLQKAREFYNVGVDTNPFPKAFYGENVKEWPSVRSGFLKEDQALKILNRYLEN